MTDLQKKKAVKKLVVEMLKDSNKKMLAQVDKAINSGALDIESWNPDNKPMIIPKVIITAILVNESKQYEAKGTSFEKEIKKDVQNLLYFL